MEANVSIDLERGWPASGLEHLGACPICGAARRTLMYEALRDIVFRCAPGGWTMWRCDGCRSAYLDPRPSQETIHLAYAVYYTHKSGAMSRPTPASRLRKLRRSLSNGYRNQRYGTRHADAHWMGSWLAALWPPGREALDVPFRFLPHPNGTETARLLDVGCGNGAFLALARTASWNVFGCDPDPSAVNAAVVLGGDVRTGSAEVWLDQEETFDAITLSHVLEHVPDPPATLKVLHRLLRPGGFLYIDTPNIDALGHDIYAQHWRGLEVPRHLTLLTAEAACQLLRQSGMANIRFRKRQNVFRDVSHKSAILEAGLDPYLDSTGARLRLPLLADASRAWFAQEKAEFLTITCEKG